MAITKLLSRLYVLLVAMASMTVNSMSAQVLPVLNSFTGRTFNGTVDVSWPVEFDGCTFITDSIVLRHSYGALFRNCHFESRSGVLYMAESGDGMILTDCTVNGCNEPGFSRNVQLSDRNYITGVSVNGEEWLVPDDQEQIIDIDGLAFSESIRSNLNGPMILVLSADRNELRGGQTVRITVRGLDNDMFIGWHTMDSTVVLSVNDVSGCTVHAPQTVTEKRSVVVAAYTEHGLEAACTLILMPENQDQKSVKGNKKVKSSGRRKKK